MHKAERRDERRRESTEKKEEKKGEKQRAKAVREFLNDPGVVKSDIFAQNKCLIPCTEYEFITNYQSARQDEARQAEARGESPNYT